MTDWHIKAYNILQAHADDLEGLTVEECAAEGFAPEQCTTLVEVLGTGAKGEVTFEERRQMEQKGFDTTFIQSIAGFDGLTALSRRLQWLAPTEAGIFAVREKCLANSLANCQKIIEEIGDIATLLERGVKILTGALAYTVNDEVFYVAEVKRVLVRLGDKAVSELSMALKNGLLDYDNHRNLVWVFEQIQLAATPSAITRPVDPRVIPPLVAQLMSGETENAQDLAAIGNDLAVDGLLTALRQGKTVEIRAAAASALGTTLNRRALRPLLAALLDMEGRQELFAGKYVEGEKIAQKAAANALVRFGPPVLAPLLELFREKYFLLTRPEQQELRSVVSEIVVAFGPASVSSQIAMLNDADRAMRQFAVGHLGKLRDEAAVEPLLKLLEHEKDINIYDAAIKVLIEFGEIRVIPWLVALLDKSENLIPYFVKGSLIAMGTKALPALIASLREGKSGYQRYNILSILREIAMKGDVTILVPALPVLEQVQEKDTNAECRKLANQLLEQLEKRTR